jgi:hypothetical protein
MNHDEDKRMEALLKAAMPKINNDAQARDLWPEVLDRIQTADGAPLWFEWALLGGILALIAVFPATISLLLYCL